MFSQQPVLFHRDRGQQKFGVRYPFLFLPLQKDASATPNVPFKRVQDTLQVDDRVADNSFEAKVSLRVIGASVSEPHTSV